MRDGSPDLMQRKVGHVDHYVRHTAAKVMADPGVIAARIVRAKDGHSL